MDTLLALSTVPAIEGSASFRVVIGNVDPQWPTTTFSLRATENGWTGSPLIKGSWTAYVMAALTVSHVLRFRFIRPG
jgi:hypothetical protein